MCTTANAPLGRVYWPLEPHVLSVTHSQVIHQQTQDSDYTPVSSQPL